MSLHESVWHDREHKNATSLHAATLDMTEAKTCELTFTVKRNQRDTVPKHRACGLRMNAACESKHIVLSNAQVER